MRIRSAFLLSVLLVASMGAIAQPPKPAAGSQESACKLLNSSDIQAVQGDSLKLAKATDRLSAGIQVSQCFFETIRFVNSVTLMLTSPATPGASTARNLWRREFESKEKEEDEEAKEHSASERDEEKENHQPPRRIDGVGDEAYWVGSAVGGALYVLQGQSFVRISVGGVRDEATRIARCKALAEDVLKRF